MAPRFPTDREEKRRVLLCAVEEVDVFYYSGLLRLKLPTVLGGAEADLVTQLEVQHLMLSDISYENQGQFALGLPDADAIV